MAMDPTSMSELNRRNADPGAGRPVSETTEQQEYDFVMGQIDAMLGRIHAGVAIENARLDRLLERVKAGQQR